MSENDEPLGKDLAPLDEEKRKEILKKVDVEINPFIKETANHSLDVLKEMNKVSLVTPREVAALNEAKDFILSTYKTVPARRTLIQKYSGVLTNGRFPTADAKFWQCKKEAEVQFEELLRAYTSYQRVIVDMKEIVYRIKRAEEELDSKDSSNDPVLIEFDIERLNIKLQEYNILMKKLEKDIKYRISEISDWNNIASEVTDEMEFSQTSYTEHELKNQIRVLHFLIEKAKKEGDTEAVKNFEDQLSTLESVIRRKAMEAIKEHEKEKES
jgi:hypothetical protein